MAISNTGTVYSWGFNGKGLLGRLRKIEEHLPLDIPNLKGKVVQTSSFKASADQK
jgi:alpha-tubulin suppressor-like RCC1 family protein